MKKLAIPLQLILFCLAAVGMNAIIFYSVNYAGNILQNKDIFGVEYTYDMDELVLQETIRDSLPKDLVEAEIYLMKQLQILAEEFENNSLYATPEDAQSAFLEASRPYNEVLSQVVYIKEYPTYITGIADNADTLLEFSIYQENGWLYNNIIQTQKDFYGLEQLVLAPVSEAGFMSLINYRITDIFSLLLTIGMAWMLVPSKELSERKKYVVLILIWFVSLCAMYLFNFSLIGCTIGLPKFQVALQSLQSFHSCPYLISCGTLLLLCLVFKLVGFGILLCIGLLCFSCYRKWLVAVLVGLVGAEVWFAFMNKNVDVVSEFLREINIFSALRTERFFLRYMNLDIAGQAIDPWPVFVFYIVLLAGTILFITIRQVSAYTRQIRGNIEQAYYDELNYRYEETRKIHHDINNHLLVLQHLIEKEDWDSAKTYIGEISEELDKNIMPVRTGSNVLDALIWQKICQARKCCIDIQTEIRCPVNDRNISDYDLCGIFGNILDNAIEAVTGMDAPVISLFIGNQLDMLYISCQNPYKGELSQYGENFATTKSVTEHHGFGIPRVREIAKLYDGEVNISTGDEYFLIQILLNKK